ncbi:MAG TPA: polysaccharide biosynthesis tyrosine autokinase [Candidatus Methylomirabilis sp.]|nr:polysaccharide biosynthesis tyrosine autokinase [Candidatus Methylomirabilis sp.]
MNAIAKQEHSPLSPRDLLLQRYYLSQEEKEAHLRDYWRIILKHRWTVFAFFVIIAMTFTIYTFTLTPFYRATATIKIDRERPQILPYQEIGSPEGPQTWGTDYIGTHQKLLQGRGLAKRVSDLLTRSGQSIRTSQEPPDPTGLMSIALSWLRHPFSAQTPSAPPRPAPGHDPQQGDSANANALLGMLGVEHVKGTSLVQISFSAPSPHLSALLANTWAKSYVDQSLELKFNAAGQANEWLSKQLQEILVRLEQAETKLHAFAKEKEIITLGEKRDFVTAKLSDLSEALTKAQSERITKEALYRQSQGLGFESIPLVLENSLIANLKIDYYKLDSEYQRLSETYKPEYPKMVQMREGMTQLKRRLDGEIRRVVDAIKEEYGAALRKERLLQAAVEQQKALTVKLNQDFIHYDVLKREVDTNRQLYTSILERQKHAGISQGLATTNVQIVDLAETPGGRTGPNRQRNILLGIILGLTVGIGMAFFFDYLDNTVKTPEELEQALGIPSLALIPALSAVTSRKEIKDSHNGKPVFELVTHQDLRSVVTEAYRNLRTSILFSAAESPPKSILLTSAQPGEGKTGMSINTAITLCQLGGDVLLIDGDMRRPSCHRFLQVPSKPGLSDYLTGHADLPSIIKRSPLPHLYCIPAGTMPVNPAELLASARMRETIELLSQRFDYIVVDSPPVLGVADALILSTMVKGVILVTHGGRTPREMVQRALKQLIEVNATVLGGVLNNIDIRGNGYYYYYRYYQGSSDPRHPGRDGDRGLEDVPVTPLKGSEDRRA